MAKMKKRSDGRYRADVSIGYSADGKLIRKTFYGRTQNELDAKLTEFKSLKNKGIVISDNNITLSEWAQKWLKTYRQSGRYNTREMYRKCVENHILTADIAQLPLGKIKKSDLQEVINVIVTEGHIRTAQIVVLTLKQIFEQAVEDNLLYKNPAKKLAKPKGITVQKRALTELENKAIMKADLTDKQRAFVYLGKYAGLRKGESLALTKNDFDMKKRELSINKTLIFVGNKSMIEPFPKTDAGVRKVPMPDILYDFMSGYLKNLKTMYLFTTESGELCTDTSYDRMWASIIKKLNEAVGGTKDIKPIIGLTSHILRHDYATSLYYAGVSIKKAQYLLGHKDIKTTLAIYTHLEEQDNEGVTEKLNKKFLQSKCGQNAVKNNKNVDSRKKKTPIR